MQILPDQHVLERSLLSVVAYMIRQLHMSIAPWSRRKAWPELPPARGGAQLGTRAYYVEDHTAAENCSHSSTCEADSRIPWGAASGSCVLLLVGFLDRGQARMLA